MYDTRRRYALSALLAVILVGSRERPVEGGDTPPQEVTSVRLKLATARAIITAFGDRSSVKNADVRKSIDTFRLAIFEARALLEGVRGEWQSALRVEVNSLVLEANLTRHAYRDRYTLIDDVTALLDTTGLSHVQRQKLEAAATSLRSIWWCYPFPFSGWFPFKTDADEAEAGSLWRSADERLRQNASVIEQLAGEEPLLPYLRMLGVRHNNFVEFFRRGGRGRLKVGAVTLPLDEIGRKVTIPAKAPSPSQRGLVGSVSKP
jgi:hypothetical protein